MLVKRALQVRGEEAVHDVHARRERELGHAAQNQRLVGGLLRVLAEEHDPAGVERSINIVVAAVNIEGVLGERARANLQHHGRSFARRVVVLLNAVDHSLAGCEVDHALAADRVRNGSALGRVLAFGLNRDGVRAEHIQLAFGIGLLEKLAAFSRRSDGIENAGVGDARLSVVADELIPVGGNANAWIASFHSSLTLNPGFESWLNLFRSVFSVCVAGAGVRGERTWSARGLYNRRIQCGARVIDHALASLVKNPCQLSSKSSGRSGKRRPKGKVTPS